MQGNDQQAYDRGTTIFSPDGRLYQVEYAREAVTQGDPVVGVRGADATVLAAHAARRSPLVEARSVEKLHRVDEGVAVGSAGHAADARRLVDILRRTAQRERLRYGEAATVASLSTAVGDHVQENTQSGGTRPYGTALLMGGYDDEPRLFEMDPSGATREWQAGAVGRGDGEAIEHLERHYGPDLAAGDALGLALDALGAAVEESGGGGPDPDDVDAVTIDGGGYAAVPDDRIEDANAS
ncbi:MAG: archaeal proteasome endopeptidase complex subunit alpha [Halobacteriales archaeon]